MSLILRTVSSLLFALMLLLSFFVFLRGHNEPGGGFIGALIGAGAFILFIIVYGPKNARMVLRVDPNSMIGLGLLFAVGSALPALFAGKPFMTGLWTTLPLFGREIDLGTPILFDVGVYLAVMGFTLTVIYSLEEEKEG